MLWMMRVTDGITIGLLLKIEVITSGDSDHFQVLLYKGWNYS